MSISAVLIVRNEAPRLRACIESIRAHVDQIVIVDTGSDDGTDELAEELADVFGRFTWTDNFADARNHANSLATCDWTIWVDGDDVIRGAEHLRGHAARVDALRGDSPAMLLMPYEYQRDDQGNVVTLQRRERMYRPREAFKWAEPVHEVLTPIAPGCQTHHADDVVFEHHREDKAAAPGRNLEILRRHYDAGYQSTRSLYYLGLEYGHIGDTGQAIAFLRRYVGQSQWDDEHALAACAISRHYCTLGDYREALSWAWEGMTAREGWFEPLYAAGRAFYFLAQRGGPMERRDWERSAYYLDLAVSRPPTDSLLFVNPMEALHEVELFRAVAHAQIGNTEAAIASCERGLAMKHDDGLASNLATLTESRNRDKVDELVRLLGGSYTPPDERPPGLDIIVFTGHAWEPWSPETAKRNGIGGSETACIEMTRRWVAAGHRVRVYGDCLAMEGKYDGVQYLHYDKFGGSTCDVLVASRRPDALDDGVCAAAKRIVWVHDIHLGPEMTHARAIRADRVMALTQWHRQSILRSHPQLHDSQVIVTRNGIDLARFAETPERDPFRCIYSSSPDRGLEALLDIWPGIKRREPRATLSVYYGFETWESMAEVARSLGQLEHIERIKAKLAAVAKLGVTHHGRVAQTELATAMLSSGVWAYPTWFPETSCITAMEAQAAGLHIVTSPIAALPETVKSGQMIPGKWVSRAYRQRFAGALIGAMRSAEPRDAIQAAAAQFSWDEVAREWLVMFDEPTDTMPPYKGFSR